LFDLVDELLDGLGAVADFVAEVVGVAASLEEFFGDGEAGHHEEFVGGGAGGGLFEFAEGVVDVFGDAADEFGVAVAFDGERAALDFDVDGAEVAGFGGGGGLGGCIF